MENVYEYVFNVPFYAKVVNAKYCLLLDKDDFNNSINRVAINVNKYEKDENKRKEMIDKTIEYTSKKEFSFAGGIYRAAGNPNKKVSAVNCTTQEPVKDSIEAIWDSQMKWARIASYGQGNGMCFSGLRPRDSEVHNCAKTSTGAVSFLHSYDAAMQVIGQGNRRGATKPDIWVYHPDSLEFINCKKDDVNVLTSQNQSVKVDDDFMEAVENDKEVELRWERIDNTVYVGNRVFDTDSPGPNVRYVKTVKARELFDEIVTAAWTTGEPGLEFWSLSERLSNSNYHPNKKYHIVSTNGCSEQKLDPWNTCILASINLAKMPLKNWKGWLEERSKFGIRALDNVVEMELQEDRSPHPVQKEKLRAMTRVGLGFTGLADWFIKNKIVYGSPESVEALDQIMKVFAEASYRENIALGKERGSFTEFDPSWYTQSEFIKQLCENTDLTLEDFTHARFVCCLSIAPTGTLSMVVEADGSGTEPVFGAYTYRKERATTGEYVENYLWSNLITEIFKNEGLELTKENVDKYIKENPEWILANDVSVKTKVDLMSTLYKYIDSGVSVTYNLPSTATKQDVYDVFMYAWKKGLKSVTVYRDGCRQGILTHTSSLEDSLKITKTTAPKRPKELPCEVHHLTVQKQKWVVLVGLLNNEPYEVFCGLQETVELPKSIKNSKLVKVKKGKYSLVADDYKIDVYSTFENQPSESAITRLISVALRHGADIRFIVEQLEKAEGSIVSFSKAISRVLKGYIADQKLEGEECPSCKGTNMARQSGCVTCMDCGWSKC